MNDYTEIDTDLLLLAAEGGDYNRREIAERISNMSAEERRTLRRALSILDECLDADAFDRNLKRDE
jgi:hypothetical protein